MASQNDGKKMGISGWVTGAGAGLIVVLAALYLSGGLPRAPSEPDATAQPAPDPDVAASPPAEPVPVAPSSEPEHPTSGDAPTFDVVRVEPDGTAVIAGSARPGSRVTILLDDTAQTDVEADASGDFVSLLTLPIADAPQVLSLQSEVNGQETSSVDQVIVTPVTSAETQVASGTDTADTAEDTAPLQADITDTTASLQDDPVTTPENPTPSQTDTVVAAENDDRQITEPAQDTDETAPASDVPDQLALASPAIPQGGLDNPASEIAQSTETRAEQNPPDTDQDAATPVVRDTMPEQGDTVAMAAPSVSASAPGVAEPDAPDTGPVTTINPVTTPLPVPEPKAVAVLRTGEAGVEVLQPAEPGLPKQVELESISYSESGDVKLRGRAGGQSVVRVYLDNVAVADIDPDDEGLWTGELAGIRPGVYTLRLDELGNSGDVLSRIETPFKREAPEDLKPAQDETLEKTPLIRAITVQTGDTLWAISRERYGDGVLYVRLFDANRDSITDPDLIYPGQVFTIPE